jgi:hypothetical protein
MDLLAEKERQIREMEKAQKMLTKQLELYTGYRVNYGPGDLCEAGSWAITSVKDCKKAAKHLGFTNLHHPGNFSKKLEILEITNDKFPKGCQVGMLHLAGNNYSPEVVYFNKHDEGSHMEHEGYRMICTRSAYRVNEAPGDTCEAGWAITSVEDCKNAAEHLSFTDLHHPENFSEHLKVEEITDETFPKGCQVGMVHLAENSDSPEVVYFNKHDEGSQMEHEGYRTICNRPGNHRIKFQTTYLV